MIILSVLIGGGIILSHPKRIEKGPVQLERICKLAEEHSWGDLLIGMAIYPDDGKTAQALLNKALNGIS